MLQPESVPVPVATSTQGTHRFDGAPEQRRPEGHMPGRPVATGVKRHAPAAEHVSVVHGTPSLHCEAVVQATHLAVAPEPTQFGRAAEQPVSVPAPESMQIATVKFRIGVATLVVPDTVCVAVMACGPKLKATVGVHMNVPAEHVAVQTMLAPSWTVTRAPVVHVPVIGGVVLEVTEPSVGVVIDGALAMHMLEGPPEQTRPAAQSPGEPAVTEVFEHVFTAEQASVVHGLLSLQSAAAVQATHIAVAPEPRQNRVAPPQPRSVPVGDESTQGTHSGAAATPLQIPPVHATPAASGVTLQRPLDPQASDVHALPSLQSAATVQ